MNKASRALGKNTVRRSYPSSTCLRWAPHNVILIKMVLNSSIYPNADDHSLNAQQETYSEQRR